MGHHGWECSGCVWCINIASVCLTGERVLAFLSLQGDTSTVLGEVERFLHAIYAETKRMVKEASEKQQQQGGGQEGTDVPMADSSPSSSSDTSQESLKGGSARQDKSAGPGENASSPSGKGSREEVPMSADTSGVSAGRSQRGRSHLGGGRSPLGRTVKGQAAGTGTGGAWERLLLAGEDGGQERQEGEGSGSVEGKSIRELGFSLVQRSTAEAFLKKLSASWPFP